MKRMIVATTLALVVAPALAQAGGMDLMLKSVVRHARAPEAALGSWSKALADDDGRRLVPCLIRSGDSAATLEAIADAGGRAMPVSGGILSAHIPPDAVAAIAARPEVVVAEAALPLAGKMDSARVPTSVDVVQSGAALGTAYNGKNVVVGVVDTSLDYTHPDFLGADGNTRMQYVQQTVSGSAVTCTRRAVACGTCAITDGGQGDEHGTHVTGMAAGSNATYTGVAPQGDIMFVFLSSTDADSGGNLATAVVEGVTTIFSKADTLDKPAVVNLSLGTSIGAHDGTSLLEEGLTALSIAKGGRIIVNAAGNEQTNINWVPSLAQPIAAGLHAGIDTTAAPNAGWRLGVWDGATVSSAFTGGTLVDLWLDQGTADSCSVQVLGTAGGRSAYDPIEATSLATASRAFATTGVPFAADASATATNNSVVATIDLQRNDARNGKPHAQILLAPASGKSGSALNALWYDVIVRQTGATACTGHMWIYYDSIQYHDFVSGVAGSAVVGDGTVDGYALANGDDFLTTTVPATAVGVIAAGSFMPPKPAGAASSTWTANNGQTYDQSDPDAPNGTGTATNGLSLFSSLGPTADGRTKPDVVTPGEPIIAAAPSGVIISSSLMVGEDHYKSQGTSMASPFLAGIVALLLERNNTLTVDQVRTALRTGASAGTMVAKTVDPENSYGAGMVNAAAILSSVGADTSLYHGTGDTETIDCGGGGGGGCSLMLGTGGWAYACGAALLALIAVSLSVLRGRRRQGQTARE